MDSANQRLQAELEKAQRHLNHQAHLLETAELRASELTRSVDSLAADLCAERESSAALRQVSSI